MAEVTGFTADRMKQIEDTTIVEGTVNASGDLILAQRDGTPINAGNIIGPQGLNGADGADGQPGPVAYFQPNPPSNPMVGNIWVDSDASPVLGLNVAYVHHQDAPAAIWTIAHNLGFCPNATVVDSGGSTVIGSIEYTTSNSLKLTFSGAFSGTAYLS